MNFRREKENRYKKEKKINHKGFGFIEVSKNVWHKEINGKVEVFELVDWKNIPELEEVVDMQKKVWGMGDRDVVPSNLLAIAGDTGGSVILSKSLAGQLNGFVFTMGMIDKSLILHMIGVDANQRYKKDLGWNLSVLQMLEAKKKGIDKIVWTYDPMRGSNARLNIEKLGAVVKKYTVNKYGVVKSNLYGEVPSDRFTAEWNINDNNVLSRLSDIDQKRYEPMTLNDVSSLPVINNNRINKRRLPSKFLVEIPYDIDQLPDRDKAMWRMKLRRILSVALDSETADNKDKPGKYQINGFATGMDEKSRIKRSYYVVSKKRRGK